MNFKQFFIKEQTGKRIGLFPGSFKPPHSGHFNNIKHFANKVDTLYVVVSDPPEKSARKTPSGKSIPGKVAADILKLYANSLPLNNVEVLVSPTPVKYVYDFVAEQTNPGDNILLGVGAVGDDEKRFSNIYKYTPENVNVNIEKAPMTSTENGGKLSATDFRNIVDGINEHNVLPFIPNEFKDNSTVIQYVVNTLRQL